MEYRDNFVHRSAVGRRERRARLNGARKNERQESGNEQGIGPHGGWHSCESIVLQVQ